MEILIPVIVLLAIGLLAALLLTVASAKFSVPEDERAAEIRECLPGANCGSCGFSGCDGYAKALSEGKCDKTNLCTPGGADAAAKISEILGVAGEAPVPRVAYVACGGSCSPEERKYRYEGTASCRGANMLYNGDKKCTYACLGYGDCARVCPRGAITLSDGTAHIDPTVCIGCGVCAAECPNGIIHVVPVTVHMSVRCSNRDKGAAVRRACTHGCLACGKCVRTCEHGAIKLIDNLAVIDYSLCTACGKCREVCPVGAIEEDNFSCGVKIS